MLQRDNARQPRLSLISAILNAYHTTRVSQMDPAEHILRKLGGDFDHLLAAATEQPVKGERSNREKMGEALYVENVLAVSFTEEAKLAENAEDRATFDRLANLSLYRRDRIKDLLLQEQAD